MKVFLTWWLTIFMDFITDFIWQFFINFLIALSSFFLSMLEPSVGNSVLITWLVQRGIINCREAVIGRVYLQIVLQVWQLWKDKWKEVCQTAVQLQQSFDQANGESLSQSHLLVESLVLQEWVCNSIPAMISHCLGAAWMKHGLVLSMMVV